MCRYAFKNYKPRFACFACRQSFRLPFEMLPLVETQEQKHRVSNCPSCGVPMADIGMDFKVPKRDDLRAWKTAEILFGAGIRYQGCGCDAGGWKPRTPQIAISYLNHQAETRAESNREWSRLNRKEERQERQKSRTQRLNQRKMHPVKD